MPPKKATKQIVTVSECEEESEQMLTKNSVSNQKKPTTAVKFNASDSDRLQLAQSINNLTVKGEQFISALNTLTSFSQEKLTELDMLIEAKKREFSDLNRHLESDFKTKQIETSQKLNEYRLKACEEMAKEYNMVLLKKEEQVQTNKELTTLHTELDTLRSTFDSRLADGIKKEQSMYTSKLAQEISTKDLNHKAHTAELTAQVAQQKREIEVLNATISNLKQEIAEQRQLTKEVAQASSKAQISQTIGSK